MLNTDILSQPPSHECCHDCARVRQRVAASCRSRAPWFEACAFLSMRRLQALEQGLPYPPEILPRLELHLPEGMPEELPPSIDRCAACQQKLDQVRLCGPVCVRVCGPAWDGGAGFRAVRQQRLTQQGVLHQHIGPPSVPCGAALPMPRPVASALLLPTPLRSHYLSVACCPCPRSSAVPRAAPCCCSTCTWRATCARKWALIRSSGV